MRHVDPVDARTVIDLRALSGRLWRHRLLIAGIMAASLVFGLAAAFLTTPRYTATATVQIDQEEQRILDPADKAGNAAMQDADRFLKTTMDVLRSRRMAGRVADEMGLFADDDFLKRMNVSLPDNAEVEADRQLIRRDAVLRAIADNLAIQLPDGSRVAGVSFTSLDPAFSADFANAFVASFLRYNVERRLDRTTYARDFLSVQLEEARVRLERAERAANAYARTMGLVRLPAAVSGGQEQTITTVDLGHFNDALAQARTERIDQESRWAQIARASDFAVGEIVENKALQDLVSDRATVAAALEAQLADRQPSHPAVVPIQRQLDRYDAQIAALASGIRQSIRDGYRAATRREAALQAHVDRLTGAIHAERDRSVQLNTLMREVETSRQLYDGLLQRYRRLSAEAGITSNNVQQIDIAQRPVRPSSPNLVLNFALALLVGLGVSALAVFLREQSDDRLRAPGAVERLLGVRLLGVTPRLRADESVMEVLGNSNAPLSESFCSLRTALGSASPSGLPPRLLVTSTREGEGKSATAFGIARAMAEGGREVLLVDCDLRRPSVHALVGLDKGPGLAELIECGGQLADVAHETGVAGLRVVTSGLPSVHPGGLLASRRFAEVLEELERSHDLVVLDAPPVLGLADAPMLAAMPRTGTIFVVEAGACRRGAAVDAIHRLTGAGGTVLGAVFSRFDFASAGPYGRDYYDYGD